MNLFSNVYLSQACVGRFADNAGCTIIFNTSINAAVGHPQLISYSASKGGQQALMRSLAKSLVSRGIRCNAVAPGACVRWWWRWLTRRREAVMRGALSHRAIDPARARACHIALCAHGIHTGPIWTPFITGAFPEDKSRSFGEENPMKRPGQPVECAPAFVFLASSDSTFVTGQTIHVDGGQFMSS